MPTPADALALAGFGVTAVRRSVDAAVALPRIARALERLADSAEDLRGIADALPAIESLSEMVADLRTLVLDPERYEQFAAALAAIVRIGEAATRISPLADAVRLTGASEFLGRLVDRRPQPPRTAGDPARDLDDE
jgi:hypothetical protein